ncbi:MAG: phosphatidate cytidylyltransferase, partial [Gammaproteobacteria bacterium]|nr:phosphatidate cytidylyltransferase [Gammaproteobacteria bacterium]
MLKQRIITACILAIVFIGTILFASHDWVRIMFAIFLGVSFYELSELTIKPGKTGSVVIGVCSATALWFWGASLETEVIKFQSLAGALLWLGTAMFFFVYRFSGQWSITIRSLFFLIGVSMLWICITSLIYLHGHTPNGGWVVLYLMTLVWIADIGAYFSGRRFGKNKLAPGISPGKTWEGVIGGLAVNILWMLLIYSQTALLNVSLTWFIAIGLATSAISVVGDLFESILKREAGVKDSGKILPGHGGVLDRFDSIIAAAPVFL